jgi:DNA-binding beta-propeller fold protein YncE
MGLRGFGNQTLTGAAQPMFGTTISTAIMPTPDQFTGNFDPRSAASQSIIQVATAATFRKGDTVMVGPASAFMQGSAINPDQGKITAVNYGAGTITVAGLTRAHAAGEFIVLSIQVATISIQNGAGQLYVGEDSSVAAGSNTLLRILAAAASYDWGLSNVGNVLGTGHIWVSGTAADTFLPSIVQV